MPREDIQAYVNPENEASRHNEALNSVIDALLEGAIEKGLLGVILELQAPLTGSDEKSRSRATLLLADILATGLLDLDGASVHHITAFFLSRLSDYPSLSPSLSGLLSVTEFYLDSMDHEHYDVQSICNGLFKDQFVQSFTQSCRAKVSQSHLPSL